MRLNYRVRIGLVWLVAALVSVGLAVTGPLRTLLWVAGIVITAVLLTELEIARNNKLCQLESIHDDTQKTRGMMRLVYDISGSVAKGRDVQRTMLHKVHGIADRLENLESSSELKGNVQAPETQAGETRKYFAPNSIPVVKVKSTSVHGQIGRGAASVDIPIESKVNYRRVLKASHDSEQRIIAAITSANLVNQLREVGEVEQVRPGPGLESLPSNTSYMIVEESFLDQGQWAGVMDAQGSDLFEQLCTVIRSAHKDETAFIVLASQTPNHFSSSLHELADFVVAPYASETHIDELYRELPVIKLLVNYTKGNR